MDDNPFPQLEAALKELIDDGTLTISEDKDAETITITKNSVDSNDEEDSVVISLVKHKFYPEDDDNITQGYAVSFNGKYSTDENYDLIDNNYIDSVLILSKEFRDWVVPELVKLLLCK
jgi:hypothetical protein